MNLCKYSNIFGLPNTGLHSIRIANLAIVDVLSTILFAWIVHYFTKWNLWLVIGISFLAGIIAHRIFCVRTTIDKLLFSS